jgi:hypothetical protein
MSYREEHLTKSSRRKRTYLSYVSLRGITVPKRNAHIKQKKNINFSSLFGYMLAERQISSKRRARCCADKNPNAMECPMLIVEFAKVKLASVKLIRKKIKSAAVVYIIKKHQK